VKCGYRYDPQSITTHEVGHFLGLGEDKSDTCATMYRATGRCQVNKRVLQSDDRAAMTGLYIAGFPDGSKTSSGCSVATAPSGDPALPVGAVLGLLVALGVVLRRRSRARSYSVHSMSLGPMVR